MYVGDVQGARATLQGYFSNQYQDQVASSGEQPFEAVRTRPFHYRCFNLEAMIVSLHYVGRLVGPSSLTASFFRPMRSWAINSG